MNALYWPSITNYQLLPPQSVLYWPSAHRNAQLSQLDLVFFIIFLFYFFLLFVFYHIKSFYFLIYLYFLWSHLCYCLPAFLPDLPSLVIFGLVRSQKSFWCKINLTFYFFSPEKCNKLAKEHNHAHSPKKWFADLGDMPTWTYSLNLPPS